MNTFQIEATEEAGILLFKLRGPATHANLFRAVAAIVGETRSRSIWNVLCDTTAVTRPVGAFERFETGAELARTADRRMKMAVVAQPDLIDYIFENVARNRGASVAVFGTESAARQWLLNEKTDSLAE